ncbi:MAG: branched-chain amino acid ABC transporter permease [Anaerolineae bacterium]|jgi:branched-chain amino acid transport system permease protein|nr:branched-chain amino acid ABC transporter permease [Anaerolineae bacterium]
MLQRLKRRVSGMTVVMWVIGLLMLAVVIWGVTRTLMGGRYTGADWLDLSIYGVAQGSIYALIALGYTLVYGILRMINFAHGEVFMSGPFIGYYVASALANAGMFEQNWVLGLLIVLLAAMAVSTSVAVLLERVAYRPLRRAPRLVPLITAIGASFFLQYSFLGLFGSGVKGYPEIAQLQGRTTIPGTGISILKSQLLVIVAAMVFLAVLYILVQRTKVGKAMQAVSEDKDTAALMGIDVDRIIVFTFLIGGALAGAAGIFYVLLFRQVHFFMGFFPGLKAFTAAVLGGIGNVVGAMLGGMFLGIAESLFPNLVLDGLGIPAPYQLKDALAFLMLVLILIFRPTGILGERLAAKKA